MDTVSQRCDYCNGNLILVPNPDPRDPYDILCLLCGRAPGPEPAPIPRPLQQQLGVPLHPRTRRTRRGRPRTKFPESYRPGRGELAGQVFPDVYAYREALARHQGWPNYHTKMLVLRRQSRERQLPARPPGEGGASG